MLTKVLSKENKCTGFVIRCLLLFIIKKQYLVAMSPAVAAIAMLLWRPLTKHDHTLYASRGSFSWALSTTQRKLLKIYCDFLVVVFSSLNKLLSMKNHGMLKIYCVHSEKILTSRRNLVYLAMGSIVVGNTLMVTHFNPETQILPIP